MKRTPLKSRRPFRRHKYGAKRYYSPLVRRWFDSKAEGRYGEHLWAREQNGEISDLEFQKTTYLRKGGIVLPLTLRVDFVYWDHRLEERVWDEFKGFPTSVWKAKKRLWADGWGPGLLRVTRATRSPIEPYEHELIRPLAEGDEQ